MTRNARRGFASMEPERRRELARRGNRSLRASGRSHRWTPETARLANLARRPITDNAAHRRAGRLGGLASAATRRARRGE